MSPWFIALVAILIITVVSRVLLNKKTALKAPCPVCEATDVVEINRETKGSRTLESFGAGTGAGGDVRLQLDLALTFRCQNCNHKFTRNFTQTH